LPLADLSAEELAVVRECLKCIAEGSAIPHDWEFQTLFGIEPSDVQAVLSEWPQVDDSEQRVYLAINNSMNSLLGLISDRELARYIPYSKGEIGDAFRKWKGSISDGYFDEIQ